MRLELFTVRLLLLLLLFNQLYLNSVVSFTQTWLNFHLSFFIQLNGFYQSIQTLYLRNAWKEDKYGQIAIIFRCRINLSHKKLQFNSSTFGIFKFWLFQSMSIEHTNRRSNYTSCSVWPDSRIALSIISMYCNVIAVQTYNNSLITFFVRLVITKSKKTIGFSM